MTFPTPTHLAMTAKSCRGAAMTNGRTAVNPNYPIGISDFSHRSTVMYAMNQALARERIAQVQVQRSHRRVAASRWSRIQMRARAVGHRQTERVSADWATATAQQQ